MVLYEPCLVTESAGRMTLSPLDGGPKVVLSRPGWEVTGHVRSGGRIIFKLVREANRRIFRRCAMRESDGRVRSVATEEPSSVTPDGRGGFLLAFAASPGSARVRFSEVRSDGTALALGRGIVARGDSTVPVPGGWLHFSGRGGEFLSLSAGRSPVTRAGRMPVALSPTGRYGGFPGSGGIVLERLSPSLNGLGTGRRVGFVRMPEAEFLNLEVQDDGLASVRSARAGGPEVVTVLDLERRRVAFATFGKAETVLWRREGTGFRWFGNDRSRPVGGTVAGRARSPLNVEPPARAPLRRGRELSPSATGLTAL